MGRPYKRFGKYRGSKRTAPTVSKYSGEACPREDGTSNDSTHDNYNLDCDDPSFNVYALAKDPQSRYYGAKLYFDEDISKDHLLVSKIEAAENFMKRNPSIMKIDPQKESPAFNINIDRFNNDEEFINEWNTFKCDLYDNPRETLNCLGLALHQMIIKTPPTDSSNNLLEFENLPMIRVKILNHRPILSVSEIKVNSYRKLISTRGCVIRVGRHRLMAQWILFECMKCHGCKIVKQPDGIYTVPKTCDNCGTSKFEPKLSSPHVKTIPLQVIKLQEHLDTMQDERGKMPRILEIELLDDLVGTCVPGDDVTVVGIIRLRGTDDGMQKGKDVSGPNALYMEAVSIVNNKNKSQSKHAPDMELGLEDLFSIEKIHDDPDVLSLLVRSMCPNIYGHEMIKAGLLLSLFGGSYRDTSPRDDIHILMVGDPGLGKSQLLQACTRLSCQGVYVCGNSSTSSGLTVTLSKENGTNDFALEPGALVLADKGTCLIDEFDKMPTQHQALLEAMEQQSVSVAKSGIICSLQARTSIIAAANPLGGLYDLSKSVINNLNLSQPLLSRFDLIFLLLDRPNEQVDSLMLAHVMNKRSNKVLTVNKVDYDTTSVENCSQHVSLTERLLKSSKDNKNVLPQSILRKYISYARQYVNPKLCRSAANVLREYYLELRRKTNIFGSLPVFHRQLEALIRLTQARAKMELRMEATEDDAREIVELYEYTLACVPTSTVSDQSRTDTGKLTVKKEIHDDPDVLSLLVHSMCPNIYGHEMMKDGLLLSLFGGSYREISPRNDIHVLMVGDPGLGKSQLLQACTRLSCQGVYVCGNLNALSGLTVTLSKENGTNDFALEPGALVLADKGTCLIDEFDKMPTQHQLNEFIQILRQEAGNDKRLFIRADLTNLADGGIIIQDFTRFINRLNDEGILLHRGNDSFRFIDH